MRESRMLNLKIVFPALLVAALGTLGNGQALAVTNDQIVSIDPLPSSEKKFYLRDGLNLQNGRIVEVSHSFEGLLYRPCAFSIVIREGKDVGARKVGLIHEGSKGFEFKDENPVAGWLTVYRSKKLIGYAAKAFRDDGYVENLFCTFRLSSSSSTLSIGGRKYTASIKNRRDLSISVGKKQEVYKRHISGPTSLYELRSGGKDFGWLVGWGYSNTPIDFKVVRILVPFTDNNGVGRVKNHVVHSLDLSKYLEILKDEPGSFTFVEMADMGGELGPHFFNDCNACYTRYHVPFLIEFRRQKGGVDIIRRVPPKAFQESDMLTFIDLFLFNFKYDNWNAVRKLFKEKIRGEIEQLNDVCRPEIQKFLAAIKQPVNIPKWTKSGYKAMLKEVWGDRRNFALNDLYYEARGCVPYAGVFEKVIGVLNLPPDADLIEKILDAHVQ